jgi:hypothetical protein
MSAVAGLGGLGFFIGRHHFWHFRELFLLGLTVFDVVETTKAGALSMSHLAARQEVRDLLKSLNIVTINERIAQVRDGHKGDVLTDPKIIPEAPKKPAVAKPASVAPNASGATAPAA